MMACLVLGSLIGLRAPFSETKPYQNWWRPDFELMKTMLKVGGPNACIVASETGMFIVAAFIVGLFGASALAAVAIANQIAAVVFMLPLSISQSCAIMVGQSAGAGRLEDVRAFGWAGGLAGLAIALPLTLLLAIYPETLHASFYAMAIRLVWKLWRLLCQCCGLLPCFRPVTGHRRFSLQICAG